MRHPSSPCGVVLTDAQLVERVQRGDSSAWQGLYKRLFPLVWRAAKARLGDREAAEDVVSETFLSLLRNVCSIEPESFRLHGWMLQVVRNKASDWARRSACRSRALSELSTQASENRDGDPALAALVDEKRQLVAYVLDQMRIEQRLVLEWKYADGLTLREIACRIGHSEKSTESLLYRARVEFRRRCKLESHDTFASESTPRANGS